MGQIRRPKVEGRRSKVEGRRSKAEVRGPKKGRVPKSEDRNPKAERRPSSEIRRPKPERGSGFYCRMSIRDSHLPDLIVFLGNQILVALDILVRFGVD